MKAVFILLCAGTLSLWATDVHSQNATVNINDYRNLTIGRFISEVESQTNYLFVYSKSEINTDEGISLPAQQVSVKSALDNIAVNAQLSYKYDNDYIVLTKRELASPETVPPTVQGITITGTITDANGEPMPGVNVIVKGSMTGTVTDTDGKYTISVPGKDAVLAYSFVGYTPQEIVVGNQTAIDIVMKENTQEIEEVVVVGYGTQRKVNLTGAVGTVSSEALISKPVTNVQELLAGTVPGLSISKGSGAVGSGATMNIRGTSTIGESSGVLVIIDGFPGNISTLNPNDIESVSVLKDAASASIYGSRAANGVMLITTKKGKETDRAIVEVASSVGIQSPQFMLDFVGSEDYMRLYDQAMVNDGKAPIYGDQGIADLKAGKYADIKWYKEIYKKNMLISNNYLAFSGQQKSITYRFSGSYDYQNGTLPNNNYNRYILKPDMTIRIFDNLSFRGSLQYTQTAIKEPYDSKNMTSASNGNSSTTAWQSQAARVSPITFIKEANGLYGAGSSMAGNPIAGVNQGGAAQKNYKEFLTILDLNWSPLKDWNIIGSFANYTYDYLYSNRSLTYYMYDAAGEIAKTANTNPTLQQSSTNNRRTTLQLTTDYSFNLAQDHHFKVLFGFSQEYFITEYFWASREGMPFPNIDVLDVGLTNKQNGGNAYDAAIRSFFGRINYDYQSKYLFEANLRADGSSRFAKGHQWGVFPSFSAGWNIAREDFVYNNIRWLTELKLRASWGILGDAEKAQIGYYPTYRTMEYNPTMYSFNGSEATGAYVKKAVNTDITWEEAAITNIGIDLGVFKQKLRFSIDYFINNRNNILNTPPVPFEFGLEAPVTNGLAMRSQGIEVLASYNDSKGDFNWGISGNVSMSRNKVTDMAGTGPWIEGPDKTGDGTTRYTAEGGQYRLPYSYIAEGLFQSPMEINSSAKQLAPDLYPGNIKYGNLDAQGSSANVIDGNDRAVIVDKVPWGFGINLNAGYKGFDFSASLYGKWNTYRYLNGYEGWAFYLTQNARPMHKDAWTPDNPGASYPRLSVANTANDYVFSSYWYRKSNYAKLQNLQIGYTFPKQMLEKVHIDYLRVYISGQNIATFTGYDGFDPEGGYYPLPRTWALGINLKF